MRQSGLRIGYFEFAVIAIVLVLSVYVAEFQTFFSNAVSALLLAVFAFFSVFVFVHVVYFRGAGAKAAARARLAQHLLLLSSLASFLLMFVFAGTHFWGTVNTTLSFATVIGSLFVLFLPLFMFVFLGASILRTGKGSAGDASVLFLVAFLILVLYFSSGLLLKYYTVNDEEFLQLHAVTLTLEGGNPYAVSFSNLLFTNASTIGVSLTSNNTIVGRMDYPALYFLSFVPFYLISSPTLYDMGHVDTTVESTVFLFILLAALAFSLKREELLKPRLVLLVFVLLAVFITVSITTYLMLALLVLAYTRIGNKYVWVLLGLCASIQEELWMPVILLLIYSLNNYGIRKGLYDIAGTLAVFLMINAYFIAAGPAAYFGAVLTPLNGFYLPSGIGAVGSALMSYYPVLMQTYTQLFDIATVALLLLFAYVNRKELVGLFSLIPLVFMVHVLPSYYVMFIFLIFFSLFAEGAAGKRKGTLSGALKRHRLAFALAMLVIVLAAAYAVYASNASYSSNFDVRLVNQTLVVNQTSETSYYSATLLCHNIANTTVYAYALVYYGKGTYLLGFINKSIVTSPTEAPSCGSYECKVNVNKIALHGDSGSYNLTATLPWANGTMPADGVVMGVYNNEYVYLGPPVYGRAGTG